MKKIHRWTAAIAALLMTTAAHATYQCAGTVTYLGVDLGGELTVRLSSTTIHKICNLNGGQGRASAATCKAIHANLLTAKLMNKPVSIYYDDNGYTCGTIPAWSFVNTVYFVEGPND